MVFRLNNIIDFCDNLLKMVCDNLEFNDIVNLQSTCKRFNGLEIKEIVNVSKYYSLRMDEIVLSKYRDITALRLFRPMNIDYLCNLKCLYMSNVTIVSPMFKYLNLEKLHIPLCNGHIRLNHMTNLKYLNIDSYPTSHIHEYRQLRQKDIMGLVNLKYLSMYGNKRITDLSHMVKLKYLFAMRCPGISQKGISSLNPKKMYIDNNDLITDVSFMTNLKVLSVTDCGQINDQSIRGLDLTKLYCDNVKKITDLNHMKNLIELSAGGKYCGLTNHGIRELNLLKLNLDYNENITRISHMSNLKVLSIKWYAKYEILTDSDSDYPMSGIDDNELKMLNLEELNANNNPRVTDLSHMSNLRILQIKGRSGVNQEKIKNINVCELHLNDNKKVTDLNHMDKLKILHIKGKSGVNHQGIKNLCLEKLKNTNNKNFTIY